MIQLVGLHLYPLKGARGISLKRWLVDRRGLRFDRRWMLVDGDGVFLSQRTLPRLALVRPRLGDRSGTVLIGDELPRTLRLEAPEGDPLNIPLEPAVGDELVAEIWGDRVGVLAPSPVADDWFTRFLDTPCRLVFLPDDSRRSTDPEYAPGHEVGLADGYPFLLLSTASLEELNRRLVDPLPMNRFRPNLVVNATDPHEEDRWARLRIGGLDFTVVKPCARCAVTTVDQASGDRGKEPLRTLATYRNRDGKVYFGQNLVHRGRGWIQVGDSVVPGVAEPFAGPNR